MGRLGRFGRMDTVSRLHSIGGPDLAIRYLELRDEARRRLEREARAREREPEPSPPKPVRRFVIVNDVHISDDDVKTLEQAIGTPVKDGSYWYNPTYGAWGVKGAPCSGFIQAGLEIGGPVLGSLSARDPFGLGGDRPGLRFFNSGKTPWTR